MDRNSIIGIALIALILFGYSYLSRPSEEEIREQKRRRDSIELVRTQEIKQKELAEQTKQIEQQKVEELSDSVKQEKLVGKYGAFARAAEGKQDFITLENDKIKLKISTLGGRIYSAEIKDYQRYDSLPLVLFEGNENVFGFNFFAQNRRIATNQMYFSPSVDRPNVRATDKAESISMRLYAGEGKYIEYLYTLKPGSYMVDFDLNLVGINDLITSNSPYLDLKWEMMVPQLEKGRDNESNYTTIGYRYKEDEVDELSASSAESEEDIRTKLEWIAFKQQFFSSILVADEEFSNAKLKLNKLEHGEHLKKFVADISIPISLAEKESIKLHYYFGPNQYKTLKGFKKEFEQLIPMGSSIIALVNKYLIIPVFNILSEYFTNYGLIILILTILIKMIIFPLTYKSYVSSAKMRVLKPQIDEIGKKYPKKEDAMKKQQTVMALYKKVGVSPLGGCLPLLIQFPILIAMFRFFPAAIELRQKSFLWADDLSTYDAILSWNVDIPLISSIYGNHISLFTLLMAAAMIVSTRLNSAQMSDANAQMPGMKFMMNVMMPVMMVFWFNKYAAGLSYYYFLSNMITIGQTHLIRRFIDDKAILAKLEENKKKPVKKSSFQKRLEEMAKQKGYKPKK